MKRYAAVVLPVLLAWCAAAACAAAEIAVSLAGEPGKQSESQTIHIDPPAGGKPPDLVFTAGDLQRTVPSTARIDGAQVRVTPVQGVAGAYAVTVNSLPERYGSYAGRIDVVDAEKRRYPPIALTLLVRLSASQQPAFTPPALVLPLSAGGSRWCCILSDRPSKGEMAAVLANLPLGVDIAGVQRSPLMSARGYGELPGEYGPLATARGLVYRVDASHARPDKYTGIAELTLVGSDRRIAIPVEVQVRASPWWVVLLLAAGIGIGRAARWMNDQGQKLLAAQRRLNDLALRAAAMDPDYRRHLDDKLVILQRLLGQNQLARFDTAMADVVLRADLLERAGTLRRYAVSKNDAGAQAALDTVAGELRFITRPDTLQPRLDAIESGLLTEPAVAAADAAPAAPRDAPPAADAPRWRPTRLQWVGILNRTLEMAGVLLLAFVGYEFLYLNGPPTFGASIADYFGALVWGLSADVATRGIASLGRLQC